MLSLMILLVLFAIVWQIRNATDTDSTVASNDISMTTMDCSTESAMLQLLETLKGDADAAGGGGATPPAAGTPGAASAAKPGAAAGGQAAGGQAAGGQQQQASDSRRDEWASPQRTEINEIKLRMFIQDEDSKYNVLNMLNPDEKESDAAFARVARILDACREGTSADIDQRTSQDMAKAMREFMVKRKQSKLPKPKLLTDLEKNEDAGMPLSLSEFRVLEPFDESHFRDFRDEDGKVVHSITSFLTVWSSLQTAPSPPVSSTGATSGVAAKKPATAGDTTTGAGGTATAAGGKSGTSGTTQGAVNTSGTAAGSNVGSATGSAAGQTGQAGAGGAAAGAGGSPAGSTTGGFGVNVNTAPTAVLKSLFDDRDVHPRFWDKVIEYRNLEDEDVKQKDKDTANSSTDGAAAAEPALDEYGQAILKRKIFDTLAKLSEVGGYSDLRTEEQAKLNQMLTTTSSVFSIYIVARKSTAKDGSGDVGLSPAEARKAEETKGDSLVRVIHAVYWRRKVDEDTKLVPIVRWEVLDYVPFEVLDFPPEDR